MSGVPSVSFTQVGYSCTNEYNTGIKSHFREELSLIELNTRIDITTSSIAYFVRLKLSTRARIIGMRYSTSYAHPTADILTKRSTREVGFI